MARITDLVFCFCFLPKTRDVRNHLNNYLGKTTLINKSFKLFFLQTIETPKRIETLQHGKNRLQAANMKVVTVLCKASLPTHLPPWTPAGPPAQPPGVMPLLTAGGLQGSTAR